MANMEERIQKILARSGYGSRRDCETLIAEGRVTKNGQKVELGTKAIAGVDTITVDGEVLKYQEQQKKYIALNKPRFVLSDRPEHDPRKTVFSLVPDSDDLFVVGRLDFESEGLILLTNDGDLANKLSHPRYGKEKEYKVLVAKRPDDDQLSKWRRGVILEDGEKTAPADVKLIAYKGDGAWLRVTMKEGRKREIREIGKQIGLPIVKLVRVRIGTLLLGLLKSGEWRMLSNEEVQALRDLVSGRPESKTGAHAVTRKPSSTQGSRRPSEKQSEKRTGGKQTGNRRSSEKQFGKQSGEKTSRKRA